MPTKAYACPRCLTLSSECEDGDGGAHTCTPTPFVRGLEEERDRYRAALEIIADPSTASMTHAGTVDTLRSHARAALRG